MGEICTEPRRGVLVAAGDVDRCFTDAGFLLSSLFVCANAATPELLVATAFSAVAFSAVS